MAAFVVYDMSNKESLSATVEWKKRINNSVCMLSGDPIPVYLLGNKVTILMGVFVTYMQFGPVTLCHLAYYTGEIIMQL